MPLRLPPYLFDPKSSLCTSAVFRCVHIHSGARRWQRRRGPVLFCAAREGVLSLFATTAPLRRISLTFAAAVATAAAAIKRLPPPALLVWFDYESPPPPPPLPPHQLTPFLLLTHLSLSLCRADEDPQCALPAIKEACKSSDACKPTLHHYQECLTRNADKKGYDCEPYYFDLLKCVDKCAIPQIGKHLK